MVANEDVGLVDLQVFAVFEIHFDAEDFEQSSKYQRDHAETEVKD